MFDLALKFVLGREGGFVDHPLDKGGATNKGITQSTYDRWRLRMGLPLRSVKEVGSGEVEAIYRRHYWIDGRCDEIAQIHPATATAHFDACVNHGLNRAARMLQEAIGTVKVDGSIGPKTMEGLSGMSDYDLARKYLEVRYRFYHSIVSNNSSQRVFMNGWLSRIRHLAKHISVEWHQ